MNYLREHWSKLFTNTLALLLGDIPMPEKMSFLVRQEPTETIFRFTMLWKGQEFNSQKTVPNTLVFWYKSLPEHESDGGMAFTLAMLDNPRLLDEDRAYWQFMNNLSSEFAHYVARAIKADWEHIVLFIADEFVPGIYRERFEITGDSYLFIPESVPHLKAFWRFPNLSSAEQAMIELYKELDRYKEDKQSRYDEALRSGTLSPYAWTAYTPQMILDHLNQFVRDMAVETPLD